MRKLACTFALVLLALSSGVVQLNAAGEPQAEDFVIVETTIGRAKHFDRLRFPVVADEKERKYPDYKIDTGGFIFTSITCPEDTGCEVGILALADRISEDEARVVVTFTFKDKKGCSNTKEFTLTRGEEKELKSKCNTKIKAYYETQSSSQQN